MLEASLGSAISEGGEPDQARRPQPFHTIGVGESAPGAPALALRYAGYALVAALLAGSSTAPALRGGAIEHAVGAAVWLWLALANAVVAYGYQSGNVAVFGKREDGRIDALPALVLAPYLALVGSFFWLKTWVVRRREPCWHEVAPGLYVGRKPRAFELPRACTRVIDLTCEFAAARDVVRGRSYRCFPILNRHVPREDALRALLQTLVAHEGGLYVHCGAGRGRSAMLAAALLVLRGHACDVDAAERRIAALRPGVKLHAAQRALITRCCATLRADAAPRSRPACASTPSAS